MKQGLLITLGVIAVAGGAFWLTRPRAAPAVDVQPALAPPKASKTTRASANVRWIAAAGGSLPEFNQVSLEQDLALASSTFGGEGLTLFAAGAEQPVVQVLRSTTDAPHTRHAPDDPLPKLADLFAPRGGRDATYRAPQIDVDGPATATTVMQAVQEATASEGPALLLYLGGHGLQGPTPAENSIALWGQSQLDVLDFTTLLGPSQRPVQVVATTCFSGGLAELAFANATPDDGPGPPQVCGLFAAPFDLEASGCDPNPDRAEQEGFGLHFLHALTGRDRHGDALASEAIDFDGDGTVALREAHAYVRIASGAPDVPTSTSERWLEAMAPGPGSALGDIDLPEENAVIAALGKQLGLVDQLERARLVLVKIENEIEGLGERSAQAQQHEDQAYRQAAAEVLARWPVLDDPWHPEFGTTLATHLDAIREHFASSRSYAAYLAARAEVDTIAQSMFDLRAKAAPYERLARALEYRQRARRLAAIGGPSWAHFIALRRCEMSPPPR